MPAPTTRHGRQTDRSGVAYLARLPLPKPPGLRFATLVAFALLAALVLAWALLDSRAKLKLDVHAQATASMQVFHSTDGVFRESDSRLLRVQPGVKRTRLRMPPGHGEHLRIDPIPGSPAIVICELRSQDGGLVLYDIVGTNQLTVHNDAGCLLLQPESGASDPFLVLRSQRPMEAASRAASYALAAFAALVMAMALLGAGRILERSAFARRAPMMFERVSQHAHWLAFGLMLALGMMIVHTLPPNGVPDEPAHLSKIAKMHAGVLMGDSGAVPVVDVVTMYGGLWGSVHQPAVLDPRELQGQLEQALACSLAPRALPTFADQYSPHLYALPTLAMAVSCEAGASFGAFLATARFLNLLLGACLIALGISQASYGKWALFVVALLPMTISQIASISSDSLMLSLALCFLGVVSGIAGGRIRPDVARLLLPALSLMIAFSRPGAAWILVCVVLCYPAYRGMGYRYAELLATSVVVPWLIHTGWVLWSAGNAHYGPGVDPEANRALLIGQPAAVAGMAFNTFFGEGAAHLYNSMIGRLGWLDVPLSTWAYPTAAFMLAASLWTNPDDGTASPWGRVLALSAVAGSMALLAIPMFLTWTQPGATIIQGLQGRYLLPALAFLLVFCAMRAPPVTRLLLLACVLCAPLLSLDAISNINLRYHGTGT